MSRSRSLCLLAIALLAALPCAVAAEEQPSWPPGWLPISRLDDRPAWADIRKIDGKIHLYLPPNVETVRGVFVCYVFHSGDPRELARLWRFALVTVPWPFEYDLGHNDKRNGRYKLGHPVQNTGLLLRYLDAAAKETGHAELAVAPLVGWLGQNGSHLCADLQQRAPDRVLAWTDSFANRLAQYPDVTARVPFAYAWEFTGKDERERLALRELKLTAVEGQPTPPVDLACRANTYGFPHGIYSKFNFFMSFLDRCIHLRLPDETPPAGQPTRLRPVDRTSGWVGDYNAVGQWNPIAPASEARGMIEPVWLPDSYAAWMWRSYHSAKPDLKLTAPVIEYRKKEGKWGGPECGLGYGGTLRAGEPLRFAAETTSAYQQIEFHDGDRIVGVANAAPYQAADIQLEAGLHALFAVGVTESQQRHASRPALVIVEPAGARDLSESISIRAHEGWVACLAFSPDGKTIVSGSDDERLRAWDAASGRQLWAASLKTPVTSVAFSPEGHRIMAGGWDGTLHVCNTRDGKRLQTLRAHGENVTGLAISPDGRQIATGSGDDTLRVWDATHHQSLLMLQQGDDYDVTCVAFSPDGCWIVSGDGENSLKLWTTESGQELLTLQGHEEPISAVAVLPDGQRIVSGSWDDTLRVWDSRTGEELMTLGGHTDDVTSLACSPDGRLIASASEDRTVKVWEARTGQVQLTWQWDAPVTSVAFSPDGKRIAAGSRGVLKIWETMNSSRKETE